MRGVSHEFLLRCEGRVQTAEHVVESVGQFFQLITWALQGDALVEGRPRQSARSPGYCMQRSQHAAGQKPGQAKGDHRHDAQSQQRCGPELAECLFFEFPLGLGDEAGGGDVLVFLLAVDVLLVPPGSSGEAGPPKIVLHLQQLRIDAELLGHLGTGLRGRYGKTVADHEEVDGNEKHARQNEQAAVPESQLEADGEAAPASGSSGHIL